MFSIHYLFFLYLCLLPSGFLHGQSKIDSLLTLLKKDKLSEAKSASGGEDTNKVNHLNSLAFALHLINPDSTLLLAKQATALAHKINFPKGKANAYGNAGVGYWVKGDYPQALENHFKALKINEDLLEQAKRSGNPDEIGRNKTGIAIRLGNIGLVYWNQADYPKALDYYFRALKINEDLLEQAKRSGNPDEIRRNKKGIASTLGNIGIVYKEQASAAKSRYGIIGSDSLYNKALDYYFRALKLAEELGDKNRIATWLGNIGIVYSDQGEAHPNPSHKEGLYNKALDYYFRALKMDEELGIQNGIARHLANIGSLYTETRKYAEAEKYLLDALKLDKEIGAQNDERQDEESLSNLYEKMGRFNFALEHYKKAMALKDTIFSEEKNKEITRKEMNYEFEKKEAATQAEYDKQLAVAEAERKKEKIIRYSVIAGLLLMFTVALVIFRSLKVTGRQKKIIEEKSGKLSVALKDIHDSIRYAERIQRAMLPFESRIAKTLNEFFLLLKPRDVVSGDFYWFAHKDGKAIIAAIDCTGHGVPGAFMSMIGNELLNHIVILRGITQPDLILSELNQGIRIALKQEESRSRDGMDIALVSLDLQDFKNPEGPFSPLSNGEGSGVKLHYAGAKNPLVYIKNGELKLIKAAKFPIGGMMEEGDKERTYPLHSAELNSGDSFYLFTDGFQDQFGGEKGKKFMLGKMKELFLSIRDKSMSEQKKILEKTMEDWKGRLEQIDDICVIGVRV